MCNIHKSTFLHVMDRQTYASFEILKKMRYHRDHL